MPITANDIIKGRKNYENQKNDAAVTALVLVGGATAANTIGSVFAEDAETSAETTAAEDNII